MSSIEGELNSSFGQLGAEFEATELAEQNPFRNLIALAPP